MATTLDGSGRVNSCAIRWMSVKLVRRVALRALDFLSATFLYVSPVTSRGCVEFSTPH